MQLEEALEGSKMRVIPLQRINGNRADENSNEMK